MNSPTIFSTNSKNFCIKNGKITKVLYSHGAYHLEDGTILPPDCEFKKANEIPCKYGKHCRYENTCYFKHDTLPTITPVICRYYETFGGCDKGLLCPFRHVRPDTVPNKNPVLSLKGWIFSPFQPLTFSEIEKLQPEYENVLINNSFLFTYWFISFLYFTNL